VADLLGHLPEVTPALTPWFPLAVGNSWTYAVSASGGQSIYTLRVASAVRWDRGTAFRAETVFGKDTIVPCQLMTTETEIWRRSRPADTKSVWGIDCLLSVPEALPQTRNDQTFTLIPTAPLTLPCGTFTDVLRLRKQAGTKTFDLWFGRGVGLLKRTCVETGVTETLVSYKVR